MSKVITSPVKRFPGTVTLQEPLFYPQVIAFRDAVEAARELPDGSSQLEYNHTILPGIIAVVESWDLAGVEKHPTPDTFPVTPNKSAIDLMAWLIAETSKLFTDDEIPND